VARFTDAWSGALGEGALPWLARRREALKIFRILFQNSFAFFYSSVTKGALVLFSNQIEQNSAWALLFLTAKFSEPH
jgi:hypothetical protein